MDRKHQHIGDWQPSKPRRYRGSDTGWWVLIVVGILVVMWMEVH